ncbi:TonB-dependent receptor [uncultured Polaribacter sp.]|uniref:TonB-dependent receptor n=1 Tax=uncultured Polaribacter sp. TaxID=174711 RepID=UPI0026176B81|nr:TonB-dependent receptor [uncultured Polaribacter sp.]
MIKVILSTIFVLLFFATTNAQKIVKGLVLDNTSKKPLQDVIIAIKDTKTASKTLIDGSFTINYVTNQKLLIEIRKDGYETQIFPIETSRKLIDLGIILLYKDLSEEQDLSLITLTDDELNDDASAADNIAGLLQATRDVYLRTAAFEFSSSFFRVRGLDSGNGKVLINGIEMNKLFDGRAQWSNWGGLNDVLRNQEFSNGLAPSNYTFGGLLGATNINTRASEQRAGTRISYASSNRSYVHRVMATHATGMLKGGWAFSFSGSRRAGLEGFNEGTSYNAYSLFTSVDKKINDKHSITFTGIFAPNRRGKSSPNTQEVFDIKGIAYNDYWGFLNGKKVNSRIKEVAEPIVMLNHFWDISSKTSLQTNLSYQTGKIGNSRIDFNEGANPSPTYYQYLPSFNLRNNDFAGAYIALQNFQNDGQLDWNSIFDANITKASQGKNAAYVLYEDRNDDQQFTANTIFTSEINDNISINGKFAYRQLNSHNFAEVIDLLGGIGYLDINPFADNTAAIDKRQNNLQNPNRSVGVGDAFKYNFKLTSTVLSSFAQAQFKFKKVDFYTAASFTQTSSQREGLYQNGRFVDTSFGKSEAVNFTNYGLKGGLTYKINGRNLIDFNAGYITQAPTIRNTFSNSRENNTVVDNLQSEKISTADVSYIFRSPMITSRLTAYYANVTDATEISFYFADGVGGDNTAFVQEVLSGIERNNLGLELGIEAQITPTIKLKGAASIGQFTYGNNPNLYLTSDVANNGGFDSNFRSKDYVAQLKNYKLAAGPQNAYSLGFEYRDPNYWWFGATTNFFSNIYVDVAPLTRSSNFYEDADGLPFNDYDPVLARDLLQQERFDDYMVVNAVGGKSWQINGKYISVFATVNNLLGTAYISGGFEQGRNANFRQLRDDKALEKPVFGNRYWYGRGTTYFLNLNLSL